MQNDKSPKRTCQSVNREKFQSFLKEQLSSLFGGSKTNLNGKRALIRIPSVEIKHSNYRGKTNPTLIVERCKKTHQLIVSPTVTQPTINNKLVKSRQSPSVVHERSTTRTPFDFCSWKNLSISSCDLESEKVDCSLKVRPSMPSG